MRLTALPHCTAGQHHGAAGDAAHGAVGGQRLRAARHGQFGGDCRREEGQHALHQSSCSGLDGSTCLQDNIRALLATLHTVLWEGSGWVQPGMADLVETARVKKAYMKANLVVHPDKVRQKGGSLEQIVIADMAFDALKSAWGKFDAK